jgi:hypothetical protein
VFKIESIGSFVHSVITAAPPSEADLHWQPTDCLINFSSDTGAQDAKSVTQCRHSFQPVKGKRGNYFDLDSFAADADAVAAVGRIIKLLAGAVNIALGVAVIQAGQKS